MCECLDVGSRLIESVGLLHSIRDELLIYALAFEPVTWELERLSFNASLAWVQSAWERLTIVMKESHDAVFLPLVTMRPQLAGLRPI